MSFPADDIRLVHEMAHAGHNQCAIERYTGISRNDVRRILGTRKIPPTNGALSVRQRQQLLGAMAA